MAKDILLIDCGTRMMNRALLKISAHHKELGDNVVLTNFRSNERRYPINPGDFDHIYVSAPFAWDRPALRKFKEIYGDKVTIGGPGWDLQSRLPAEIEAMPPDYELYSIEIMYPRMKGPGSRAAKMEKAQALINSGLGRTTYGCTSTPSRCSFCIVPLAEGKLRQADELMSLKNPRSRFIHLLDNNFSADPKAIEKLRIAQENDLVLGISQGIDIRLSPKEFLEELCRTNLWHRDFFRGGTRTGTIWCAWDRMQDEKAVLAGLDRLMPLAEAAKKEVTVYLLAGYDTSHKDDEYRINVLKSLGCRPYIMGYREGTNEQPIPRVKHLAKFVAAFLYRNKDFDTQYAPWIKHKAALAEQGDLFAAA